MKEFQTAAGGETSPQVQALAFPYPEICSCLYEKFSGEAAI